MKRMKILRVFALAGLASGGAWPLFAQSGFESLFNGDDLAGWKTKGDAQFSVREGCLVGTQDTGKGGDIATEKSFADFEFRATYRVKWPANSGFWFRWDPETGKGYQFDILKYKKPVAYSGTIYCPGKLFLTTNENESLEKRDDWNEARIWAKGDHLIVWLNGKRVGESHDTTFSNGRMGIQVHGGDAAKGMEIVVKDMKIRAVPADEPPPSD